VVEENNIAVQISALRKLLGPATLVTIPGRGYRFAAPLHERSSDHEAPRPAPAINAPARDRLLGRDRDVDALCELMRAHRLVTIVGAGGIGKTRLAREMVERLAGFGDGVWWVDLAAVSVASRI